MESTMIYVFCVLLLLSTPTSFWHLRFSSFPQFFCFSYIYQTYTYSCCFIIAITSGSYRRVAVTHEQRDISLKLTRYVSATCETLRFRPSFRTIFYFLRISVHWINVLVYRSTRFKKLLFCSICFLFNYGKYRIIYQENHLSYRNILSGFMKQPHACVNICSL